MIHLWVDGAKLQAKIWQNNKNSIILQRVFVCLLWADVITLL